jgi:hypothetical protein
MGTLIRKMYSQPSVSTIRPPSTGPAILPIATAEPRKPIALPRSFSGNAWKRMAPLIEKTIAAPNPWRTRQATSMRRLDDRPQARELRVKMVNPAMNRLTLPKYSESLPKMSSRLVIVSR